jgi:O-antigen/teichoic acid export membrane protein
VLRRGAAAAHVAGSQVALAASNYVLLAIAARHLDPAGFAAVSAYYLLINTVGRGLFAAVELETTRAVAAGTHGMRAALRHTGLLLVGALVLLGLAAPLLTGGVATVGLLAVGAVTMAASYLVRGPLAGLRRYGHYAATFWIEAGVGLAAAVALTVIDEHATAAWIAVLALAPGVAPLLLLRGSGGSRRDGDGAPVGPVLWSAALLLAGQGVWNLAPVLVTARLADAATLAAGFTTVAVVVRAPVLLFPTIQAMLLPRLAGGARTPRALVAAVVGAGILWVAVATSAVPFVAALVFATTAPPAPWIVAVLALSIALGSVAQVAQAQLVAVRRTHAAALAWLAGLVALIATGLAAAPPIAAASIGQLAAAGLVLGALVIAGRKP